MLSDRDQRHAVLIEEGNHLAEIFDAARNPIQLEDHHHIDLAGLDGRHQAMQAGALKYGARHLGIAIGRTYELPTHARLAGDVSQASVELGINGAA
jgi:hypothetical protein